MKKKKMMKKKEKLKPERQKEQEFTSIHVYF